MANEQKTWRELRDAFFTYTRAERNGLGVALLLCFVMGCLNIYYKYFRVEHYDYTEAIMEIKEAYKDQPQAEEKRIELFSFDPNKVTKEEMLRLGFKEKAIKTFIKYRSTGAVFRNEKDFERVYSIDSSDIVRVRDFLVFGEQKTKKGKPIKTRLTSLKKAPTLFDFDPNTASEVDLKKLGLSQKVVRTMMNFRKKATFRKPSDVSKIYGLKGDDFEKLRPYIKIVATQKWATKSPKQVKWGDSVRQKKDWNAEKVHYQQDTVAKNSIDINRATIEEWQRIDGIGPTYARMINNFRGKLGGFYNVSQIGETFGLPDSVFQKIVPFVKPSSPPFKIQVNLILTDSLARHPYLTWKQARVITNYRAQHGPYKGPKDVAKVRIFTKEKWARITPYLDYETAVDTFDHDMR